MRGAFIIGGYGAAAALFLLGSLAGLVPVRQVAAGFALPLGLATACYTAYLFAQARARDLWQSPLLAPHLAVQAVLAGAAAIVPFAAWLGPPRSCSVPPRARTYCWLRRRSPPPIPPSTPAGQRMR